MPWIVDGIDVRMYRRRPNGTLAIHRSGVTRFPAKSKTNEKYVDLSAPRETHIYYGIDDPYDWREHCCRQPRPSLKAKWKRNGRKIK